MAPQLETIYWVVYRQVLNPIPFPFPSPIPFPSPFPQVCRAAPSIQQLTLHLLFTPGSTLPLLVADLSATNMGIVLGDLRLLLFPSWSRLGLPDSGLGVLMHLLHLLLAPLLQESPQTKALAALTVSSRTSNYSPMGIILEATRHLFLAYWHTLILETI